MGMNTKTDNPPVQAANDQPDVPPGYKRTDLGAVPTDWQTTEIDQLLSIIRNGAVYEPVNNDGVPITRIETISDGLIDMSHTGRARYADELASYKIQQGDILYSHINSLKHIGKVAFFAGGVDLYHGMNLLLLRPKENISALWLFYLLDSEPARRWARSIAKQAVNQASINTRELKQLYVPVPPPEEQRAIAEALSDVDGLIGALEKLIAKKRAIKQAAMQQLLTGKTRLPGFTGEWETKTLGELGVVSAGGVNKKIRAEEPPVRLVNYMDVYRRTFIRSANLNHVVSAPPEQAVRCAVRTGDIFFTPSSEMPYDIAVSAVAVEDIPDACYSYHVVRLRLAEDWDLKFRAYAFKTQAFLDKAARTSEGSGVRYVITQTKFRQLTVRYPFDKREQAAIAKVLSDMDAEIEALERRRDKAKQIKQGMMQQLLTGRVRLVKPEPAP